MNLIQINLIIEEERPFSGTTIQYSTPARFDSSILEMVDDEIRKGIPEWFSSWESSGPTIRKVVGIEIPVTTWKRIDL